MLCTQNTVTLVMSIMNPFPPLLPLYPTLEGLSSKAFLFQSNLHGHLPPEMRSAVLIKKEDLNVPKTQSSACDGKGPQ